MDFAKFLEKDVPECYFSMAVIEAASDYYMFYEAWAGAPEQDGIRTYLLEELPVADEDAKLCGELVAQAYNEAITDGPEFRKKAFGLREKIKSEAMTVATYTDAFSIYDYIVRRCNPVSDVKVQPMDTDISSRDILSAIFGSGDNAVINENIKTALSQLPIRMTKAKFFDTLEDALKRYIGTDRAALDRELFMLRGSAGIYERNTELFPDLEQKLEYLAGQDFTHIDATAYEKAVSVLVEATKMLTDLSEALQSIQQIVNYLCVIAITYPRVEEDYRSDIGGMRILTDEAAEGLKNHTVNEMSTEALSCLEKLEGRFEPLVEKLARIQTKAASAYKGNTELTTPEVLEDLDICERLVGSSVFADLKDEESSVLTEDAVMSCVDRIKEDLSEAFSKDSKPMQRARMAAVISQLPVFFNSRTEVMNYVRDSLDGCRDAFEKNIAVSLVLDSINGRGN